MLKNYKNIIYHLIFKKNKKKTLPVEFFKITKKKRQQQKCSREFKKKKGEGFEIYNQFNFCLFFIIFIGFF